MPEQEFLPPRRLARSYRPDHQDEEPPPWANLPPVRPQRPGAGELGADDAYADDAYADELRVAEPVPQWAAGDADDSEDPPRPQPREPGGRAARSAARRRRRWLVTGGVLVVLAGAVTAVVLLTGGGPGPAAVTPGTLITTFQPGELKAVPQACKVVPAATVQRYLPGKVRQAAPLPVNGRAGSACNWTLDQAPTYRLMELSIFAYAPNGLATGDGSATNAAIDGYASDQQSLRSPPKGSPAPKAAVTMLPGFGNQAFSAMQVFKAGGAVTDVATVVVRYHNVVVTATLNGLEHSNRGTYGPVSQSGLSAAALAFAQAAQASLHEGQVTPSGH